VKGFGMKKIRGIVASKTCEKPVEARKNLRRRLAITLATGEIGPT
jgi:hypothetical protein